MYEKGTADKPEVYGISERLGGLDVDAVVGKLLRIWAWFDDNTTDGVALDVTNVTLKALLNSRVGVTGFCEAMIAVGWLSEEGGNLSIPEYERHNGATAKTRWQSRLRQSRSRQERDICHAKSVTNVTQDVLQKSDTIEIEIDSTHTHPIVAEGEIPKPGFPSREDVLAYATRKGWSLQSAAKFWLHHDSKRSDGEPYAATWHWWSRLEMWVMNDAAHQGAVAPVRSHGRNSASPIEDYQKSDEWDENQMTL